MTELNYEYQVLNEMKVPPDYRANGFIYVLGNALMPGVYKIGMTTKTPEERAKEISSATGVPQPFHVIAAFHSRNPARDEKIIHEAWDDLRICNNREFFKMTEKELDDSLSEFASIVGPERNGDIEELAMFDSFISFCKEPEIDLEDLLIEQGIGGIRGHEPAVRNFLVRAGMLYAKDIFTKYHASIVINPDGSIALVKSLDIQQMEARDEEQRSQG